MLQTDISVWPKVEYLPNEEIRVAVFCLFHAFTPKKMCQVLKRIHMNDGKPPRVLFFGDPALIGRDHITF